MAKYNLDEMAIMAKERKIDSSNLQDVMKSLADYNIDNETVRYILEELVASENMPEEYRKWIDDVLDNYDELLENNIIEPEKLENLDVREIIMDKAPEVIPTDVSTDESSNLQANDVQESSVVNQEALVVPVAAEVIEEFSPETIEEESPILSDVSIELEGAREELNAAIESGKVDAYIIDDSYSQVFAASANYQNNDAMMKAIIDLARIKGINIIESEVNEHNPVLISMELTAESKPYLDNLLLQLYGDEKNHLNVELIKDNQTGKEMLVMNVNDKDLSYTEVQKYSSEMLQKVNAIIESTDKNKDYEALMDPRLREIRNKFHADENDIKKANDVEFVYSNEDGHNTYHIVAESETEAKEVVQKMGYEIKENRGGGVFEIDDRNISDVENTKMGKISKNVNYTDEVKEIDKAQGISNLNIHYNNVHYYGENSDVRLSKIYDFIEESNEDNRTISQVTIDTHGNQRIVKLSNTNGYNDTVVIQEGKEFDTFVLPAIADVFSKDCEVSGSKTYEEDSSCGYFADNSNNTRLIMNGYDEKTIDQVEGKIENNKVQTTSNDKTENKAYGKVLGVYPTRVTNYSEAANTSFATLLVFSLVMIFGIIVIYIIFGG